MFLRKLRWGHHAIKARSALGLLDQTIRTTELVEMEKRLAALEEQTRKGKT